MMVFCKVGSNGAYEVTGYQRTLRGFLDSGPNGACFGMRNTIKNKPRSVHFGIPIGVRFEKHRASTRKTMFRVKLCSPNLGGTPKRGFMREEKDLYILLDLVGPAPYIDLLRSRVGLFRSVCSDQCLLLLLVFV